MIAWIESVAPNRHGMHHRQFAYSSNLSKFQYWLIFYIYLIILSFIACYLFRLPTQLFVTFLALVIERRKELRTKYWGWSLKNLVSSAKWVQFIFRPNGNIEAKIGRIYPSEYSKLWAAFSNRFKRNVQKSIAYWTSSEITFSSNELSKFRPTIPYIIYSMHRDSLVCICLFT